MLEVLHDASIVKRALAAWRRTLKSKGITLWRNITHPQGVNEQQIVWLKDFQFWASIAPESTNDSYYCPYGFCDAALPGDTLNISLQVNPTISAKSRAWGRIVRNEGGQLLLAHLGGRGGGRGRQVSKEDFHAKITGIKLADATRPDGRLERLFILGQVDRDETLKRVASYVRQAENLAVEAKERWKVDQLLEFADGRTSEAPGSTSTRQEIEARLGQGKFRKDVLRRWGGKCAVSGVTRVDVIRASHIRPWSACCDARDKLDPQNGLPLVPTYDVLFDRGLISFESDGSMIVSAALAASERKKLGVPAKLRRKLVDRESDFMQFHRANVFQKE